MKERTTRMVPGCLALLIVVAAMHGATLYTYTGNPFTDVGGTFTTSMRLTGNFTLNSPLADNLSGAEIFPTDYTFFNGIDTDFKDPLVGGTFFVSTDATGAITAWVIQLGGVAFIQSCSNGVPPLPTCSPTATTDDTVTAHGFASVRGSPGTWASAQIPEPSTFCLLLGAGLCLGAVKVSKSYSAKHHSAQ